MFAYGVSPLWNVGGAILFVRALIEDDATARAERVASVSACVVLLTVIFQSV
jgi:hypothetical protein